MSPDEFARWRDTLGLTQHGAAATLGISWDAALAYADGRAPVPTVVQLACAALAHGLDQRSWAPLPGGRNLEARTNSLRVRLLQLFPDFSEYLAGSYHARDDGSFTPCGLLSEFSSYYIERIRDFSAPPVATFFALIETIMAADPHDHDLLANAVATCFLENISNTEAGEAGRTLMGPACTRFFAGWHRAEG